MFAISNLCNDERIEYYLDYERTNRLISENQLLFCANKNSGFLSIKEHDESFPYNILGCINKIAINNSLTINKRVEKDKAIESFGGMCKCLVISVV